MKPRIAPALAFVAVALLAVGMLFLKTPHTIVLVRHAEKADKSKDTVLSPIGEARAVRLAETLGGLGVQAIYVTEYRRTQQTAQPLAQRLGLTPAVVAAGSSAELIRALRGRQHTVLVVGHSDTLPDLIRQLGVREPVAIPADEFHHLYIVVTHRFGPPTLLRLGY